MGYVPMVEVEVHDVGMREKEELLSQHIRCCFWAD